MLRLLPALLLAALGGNALAQVGPSPAADSFPAPILSLARGLPSANLRLHVYALASPAMEGRRMGTRGDTASARYVEARFAEWHLAPPTHNGYFQAIEARRLTRSSNLTLGNRHYGLYEGWNLYPPLDSFDLVNAPVVFAGADTGFGYLPRLLAQDLSGKVLLLPGDPFRLGQFDRLDSAEALLRARGARAVLWGDSLVTRVLTRRQKAAFLPEYATEADRPPAGAGFPEIGLLPSLLRDLLSGETGISVAANGSLSGPRAHETFTLRTPLTLQVRATYRTETAPNVLGILRGTDPVAACVVVTAHRDHDGLDGKTVYPGAVDNASGTAALLQLARLMQQAVDSGYRPKRTIVFASVTGEERGLLGSYWYTHHPAIPLSQTRAVLNIDMLGRVDTFYKNRRADSNYVYYLVEDSAAVGLQSFLFAANKRLGTLHLDDRYTRAPYYRRMLNSSDHYPFYQQKIPVIALDTGFCEDYHQPTDTPNRINYDLLTRQTQLAFLVLWKMAN